MNACDANVAGGSGATCDYSSGSCNAEIIDVQTDNKITAKAGTALSFNYFRHSGNKTPIADYSVLFDNLYGVGINDGG